MADDTVTPPRLRIGLTGGIGSGKSTVARMLADLGLTVIDADAVSRQSTAAGGAAIPEISRQFGPAFITPDGALDRDRMRQLVFSDPDAKTRLETIIHPIVRAQMDALTEQAGPGPVVLDMPLLVESQAWQDRVDTVWVVDCLPETQIQRVMQRNGWPREQILSILATQATREQRLAVADTVIDNDQTTLDELRTRVSHALSALQQRFGL